MARCKSDHEAPANIDLANEGEPDRSEYIDITEEFARVYNLVEQWHAAMTVWTRPRLRQPRHRVFTRRTRYRPASRWIRRPLATEGSA